MALAAPHLSYTYPHILTRAHTQTQTGGKLTHFSLTCFHTSTKNGHPSENTHTLLSRGMVRILSHPVNSSIARPVGRRINYHFEHSTDERVRRLDLCVFWHYLHSRGGFGFETVANVRSKNVWSFSWYSFTACFCTHCGPNKIDRQQRRPTEREKRRGRE